MSQATVPFPHPMVRAVDGVAAILDEVAGSEPMFLTTGEKERLLVSIERQIARLESLRARTLAAADDVAECHGARSPGAWLAHETRQDVPAGRRAQRLAHGLDRRWPQLAEAHADGSVSTAQVQVIGKALDDLPADLDDTIRSPAGAHL